MKRWRWAALASLIVGVLVLHHEVLLGGLVYHNEDAADGYYPSHVAIQRALGKGELPTWEPGAWAGWPLHVDPYYGLYYPLSAIYAVWGAVRGLGVTVALHALLAGLGMLWLMRRRKLDWGPALFAAVSLAFGSFMVERIRHIIFAQMMAWLPLILVGVEGYLAERRARWLVLAAAATGMALVCGALPLAPFVVLTVGGYVAARLAAVDRAARLRTLTWLGTAALAGGLVAAAQIVPTVAHLPYSPRSLGVDYQFASSYAWPDVRYLGVLIAPDLFGGADRGHWFGVFNHWEMAGWYTGALTVLLAPLGLVRRRPELWALGAVALLGILLAFGDHAPVHRFFFHYVPLYGALRCPTRALVMDLVALPILGAEGLAWLSERVRTRRAAGLACAIAFAVAGVVAASLLHAPAKFSPAVVATRHAFGHFALVVGAGGALASLLVAGVVRAPVATFAIALVSLVDLVSVSRGSVQPKPRDWAEGTERFTAVDWLLEHHPADRFITDYRGPFRLHNLGMTYDLEGAGGYESFTVWRYVNLLYTINNGQPYPFDKLKQDLAAGDVRRFDTPLVDLLNLRWFIGLSPPAPHWVERFRPTPGARPHAVHEPTWDPQLVVYENPRVLPRAFVVHHASVLPTDRAQAAALVTLDPRADVILDAAPSPPPSGSGLEPARVTTHERARVVVDSDAPSPGVLVLADTWYPGWRVTVDGAAAPLLRADYAFRGVALPAGHHLVEFTYRARPAAIGLWLSLLGLLSLGGIALIGRKRPSLL
ncbi:MAG: hypothetical protein JWN44_6292 [Myxococcales bacterium]|nr:hypothetical protein [Myxococcales bacterium]